VANDVSRSVVIRRKLSLVLPAASALISHPRDTLGNRRFQHRKACAYDSHVHFKEGPTVGSALVVLTKLATQLVEE
jgi:hypothetical protein